MDKQEKTKVLILTGKAGHGHISIAEALEYWTKKWGFEPKVLDVLPLYANATYKINLKTKTYRPVFQLTNNKYLARALLAGFNKVLEEKVSKLCKDYKNYPIAISTHPALHPSFSKINIIIVPDPTVHKIYFAKPIPNYYISYWNKGKNYTYLGPIARAEFYNEYKNLTKQQLKSLSGLDINKTSVLVLAGGEWINRSKDYLDAFAYCFDPQKYEFIFICGKNIQFKKEQEKIYKLENFKFFGWLTPRELNKIMRAADCGLCFSTGSAVVIETGLCKLPLYIMDNIGGQEEGFIEIIEKNKVGKKLQGDYWDKIQQLKRYLPKTQKMFEENTQRWGNYLLSKAQEWEKFFKYLNSTI